MIRPEVYQENGYADRADYLNCLSEDYGIPAEAIIAMAEVLGPDEDQPRIIFMPEQGKQMICSIPIF